MLSFSLYDADYYVMQIFLNSTEIELIYVENNECHCRRFVIFGGSGGIGIIS